MADGAEAMRNDKRRTVSGNFFKRFHQLEFCCSVQGACCLIQYKDGRVFEYDACNR